MGDYMQTLDFAIQREEQAYDFYITLAHKATSNEMRAVLAAFAEEELRHKAILSSLKTQAAQAPDMQLRDISPGDDSTDIDPTPDMSYRDALRLAIQKEANAFRFYRDFAAITKDEDLRNTFLTLAQEEAKHKQRFEEEYERCA